MLWSHQSEIAGIGTLSAAAAAEEATCVIQSVACATGLKTTVPGCTMQHERRSIWMTNDATLGLPHGSVVIKHWMVAS